MGSSIRVFKDKKFFREATLVLLGGFLALAGSFLSSYLSVENANNTWERATKIQINQRVIDQRLRLIDRTALVLNKTDYLAMNSLAYDAYQKVGPAPGNNIENWIKVRKVMAELNSEFMAVSTLNNMFFGPQTKKALKNIMDATNDDVHWWEVERTLLKAYLEALHSEFSFELY